MNRVLISTNSRGKIPSIDSVKDPGKTLMFTDMQGGEPSGWMFIDHEFAGDRITYGNFNNTVLWGDLEWCRPLPDMPYRHGYGNYTGKRGDQAIGGFNVACVEGNVLYVPRVLMPPNTEFWVNENKAIRDAAVKLYVQTFVR